MCAKKHPIRIGTVNVRSLYTTSTEKLRTSSERFIRFLREQRLDVLALQETNIDLSKTNQLNVSLFTNSSIWTKHVALLCMNHRFVLTNSYVSLDQRVIVAQVARSSEPEVALFSVCAIYAPSGDNRPRNLFFQQTLLLPFFQQPINDFFVLGDFNYHHHHRGKVLPEWRTWIDSHSINIITRGSSIPLPTFTNHNSQSTIDYIFASPSMAEHAGLPQTRYIHRAWTDHSLLSCDIQLDSLTTGPGVWRMNSSLLEDETFTRFVFDIVDEDLPRLMHLPPEVAWDSLKSRLQDGIQQESMRRSKERKEELNQLQRRRQHLLQRISWLQGSIIDRTKAIADLKSEVEEVERLLDLEQDKRMSSLIIRARIRYQDLGEQMNRYCFNLLKSRTAKRTITYLLPPNSTVPVTDPEELCRIGHTFYTKLYSTEEVDMEAIQEMISNLPATACLPAAAQQSLTSPVLEPEVQDSLDDCAVNKAPGKDGFPFELFRKLLSHTGVASLLTKVMDRAIRLNILPASWTQTIMILLYKKGEAGDLANWRPLSLINSDAKIYTKLLTRRLQPHMEQLIGPAQTGFVKGRRISDNGIVMATIREHCKKEKISGVGVLLDQEKAYDRVHPTYLRAVMDAMLFPAPFTNSIFSLFFSTRIQLNINGYLTDSFTQHRGLRQGDPLSPLLFNLAIEPLIQTINNSPAIIGIPLGSRLEAAPPLKVMAYADDLGNMIRTATEWSELKRIMDVYGRASNARLNLKKTVAFPLGKGADAELFSLLRRDKVQIHSTTAESALVYLGFPISLNTHQRDAFYDGILNKIKQMAGLHSQRGLSVRGRGLIAQSLLLSKVWHVLSVDTPTQAWIKKVHGVLRKFLCPHFPAPSFEFLCQGRTTGGVGLIDIGKQILAFRLRSVQRITTTTNASFAQPIIHSLLRHLSQSEYSLAMFLNPDFYLGKTQKLFQGATTIKKLVSTTRLLPSIPPYQGQQEQTPIDSVLSALTTDWIAQAERPPQPPCWRMDQTFQLTWSEQDHRQGRLEFIPATARPQGLRSNRAFEQNVRNGTFPASDTLQRLLDRDTVINTSESLSLRINSNCSQPGTDSNFGNMSTRAFRQLISKPQDPVEEVATMPSTTPRHHLTPRFWTCFWKADIPHRARTVWWRLLINKLPSRKRLHTIMPGEFETSCLICGDEVETDRHMLFTCPKKIQVWRTTLSKHVGDMDFSWEFIELLLYDNHEQILPINNISAIALLATILFQIWKYHFNQIRDDEPFDPAQVSAAIDIQVQLIVSQNNYRRQVQVEKNRALPAPTNAPTNFPT